MRSGKWSQNLVKSKLVEMGVGWEVSEHKVEIQYLRNVALQKRWNRNSQGQNTKVHKQIKKHFNSVATHEKN